jgi:simple sugar transport system permease protein
MFKQLINKHESVIGLLLIVVIVVMGLINPNFFSLANVFSLLRSATIMAVFSMGVLIVLISGGIDVSFTGIAIFSMYTTVFILVNQNYTGGMLLPFIMSGLMGLGLGLINGVIIGVYKLPTLIVTIGTLSAFRGAMLFFVGSNYFNQIQLPIGMNEFARANVFTVNTASGIAGLHPTFFIAFFLAVFVWYVLKYTMLGRSFYAMGGNRESAERAGFNILRTQLIIYGFVGLISGIGGMIVGTLFRQANPFSIVGTELDVIAAAVLGGASITGGRGSVFGTLLGVVLITIARNNLVLLGIPSEWQRVVIGFFIILGTAIPLAQTQLQKRRQITKAAELQAAEQVS